LHLDAERAAAGEEMLRSFLDLLVLRHDGFASGLSLLLAHKLTEDSMPAERLGEIARAAMAGDPGIITAAIADLVAIRTRDPARRKLPKTVPGNRDHGISEERRHVGKGGGDGEPCLDAHDAALRSPARRAQPR
jgi:hypothetical protein